MQNLGLTIGYLECLLILPPNFTLQIASLDSSRDLALLQSLKTFRVSMCHKDAMVAFKKVMKELHSCLNSKNTDDISLYCTIAIELLFIPEAPFIHSCYLSHIKSQPVEIKTVVMKGWVERVQQLAQTEPFMAMEIVHSIAAMGIFSSIQIDIAMTTLDVIAQIVKDTLESDIYLGEETEGMLEKVSTMGYSILTKCSQDISSCGYGKLQTCCLLVIRLLKVCWLLYCPLVCFHVNV